MDMDRREFLVAGTAGLLSGRVGDIPRLDFSTPANLDGATSTPGPMDSLQDIRSQFPRLAAEAYINGAAGTPLSTFTEAAIDRYLEIARYGNSGERGRWWTDVWTGIRRRFAGLIGAEPSEIGFAESTKAGEQLVLEGLPAVRDGGAVVTNDLHFQGSLHNLEGLRRSGHDVRIVRSDGRRVPVERMIDAIDDRTALVTVSLISNVNGHIEEIAEIARVAHAHGAFVFADIIQGAGIIPIDVHAMGIDAAACSSYKWLFGLHGAGFLFVAERHQGGTLPDTRWPGGAQRLYPPFRDSGTPGELGINLRMDADRYRPGHVNYLGYAAVDAGLRFIERIGVDAMLAHSVRMNGHILEQLDTDRYEVLTPDVDRSPILSLATADLPAFRERLAASNVVVSTGGDRHDLIRISPAIYNHEADMDRLVEVLNG